MQQHITDKLALGPQKSPVVQFMEFPPRHLLDNIVDMGGAQALQKAGPIRSENGDQGAMGQGSNGYVGHVWSCYACIRN